MTCRFQRALSPLLLFLFRAFFLLPALAVPIHGLAAAGYAPVLVWDTPSEDEHGSMPLGNGETGINLWAEDNGRLSFYLARTDAWSGNVRLLKLGLIHVQFTPNPFAGGTFRQTLDAEKGRILLEGEIGGRPFQAGIWVDAHHSVVHVEASSEAGFDVRVFSDPWRTAAREVDAGNSNGEIHSFFAWRGGDRNPTVQADRFNTSIGDALVGYYRNVYSNWRPNLEHQKLGEWADANEDPLINRTFGYLIAGDGLVRESDRSLRTARPTNRLELKCVTHTGQAETAEDWVAAIDRLYRKISQQDLQKATQRHIAWWQDFWQRSYVDIELSRPLFVAQLAASPAVESLALRMPIHLGATLQGRFNLRGTIDDFTIWEQALSPGDVADKAAQAAGQAEDNLAPQLAFRFDKSDGQAGVYASQTGTGHTARNRGNTRLVGSGTDRAVRFGGKDWLAVVGDDLNLNRGMTASLWVKPGINTGSATLLHGNVQTAAGKEPFMLNLLPGGSLEVRLGGQAWPAAHGIDSSAWHQLDLVLADEVPGIRLFVDGTMLPLQSADGATPGALAPGKLALPLHLGADLKGRSNYRGDIAAMRLWSRPLPDAAVKALAEGGLGSANGDPRKALAFSFDAYGEKKGVYPSTTGTAHTARNRGNTSSVASDTGRAVHFGGEDWLAVVGDDLSFDQGFSLGLRLRHGPIQRPTSLVNGTVQTGLATGPFALNLMPGNKLRLHLGDRVLTAPFATPPEEFYHLMLVVHPGARDVQFHVDGQAVEWTETSGEIATLSQEAVDEAYRKEAARVRTLSEAYNWQRFVSACAGRGDFPIKFNGSLFTVRENEGNEDYDADYRRWGGPYWFQNTRLAYWPMLMSGDWDMMKPFFETYMRVLPLAKCRAQEYFGHPGAYFFETMEFWGGSPEYVYGWREQRRKSGVEEGYPNHPMHKYHFNGGLELSAMMLDYYRFSQNGYFVREYLIPMANPVLTFFSEHYPRDSEGMLEIAPSQALESWQDVVNPSPEIAGLHYVLDGLLELPADLAAPEKRAEWQQLKDMLPPVPLREINGEPALWVADQVSKQPRNAENPELYPIFPYRLFGLFDPDNIEPAKRAFENRRVSNNTGWSQDDAQAALLGDAEAAAEMLLERSAMVHQKARFPAFWQPNYDWIPDQDHGSVLMIALQFMLMQSFADGSVAVLPAWPPEWNVRFRLHAYGDTVVTGVYEDGKWVRLQTDPENQRGRLEPRL